ncbi:MAG: BACON domain-containing protein [Alistipes sp.]|nr:BACON domain-containing protein [Alistipes sp.]
MRNYIIPLLSIITLFASGCGKEQFEVDILHMPVNNVTSDCKGETHYIEISAFCDWEAKCNCDWITLNNTTGEAGNSLLVFTTQANYDAGRISRNATITIYNSAYEVEQTIEVKQENAAYLCTFDVEVSADKYSADILVTPSDDSVPWYLAIVEKSWYDDFIKKYDPDMACFSVMLNDRSFYQQQGYSAKEIYEMLVMQGEQELEAQLEGNTKYVYFIAAVSVDDNYKFEMILNNHFVSGEFTTK